MYPLHPEEELSDLRMCFERASKKKRVRWGVWNWIKGLMISGTLHSLQLVPVLLTPPHSSAASAWSFLLVSKDSKSTDFIIFLSWINCMSKAIFSVLLPCWISPSVSITGQIVIEMTSDTSVFSLCYLHQRMRISPWERFIIMVVEWELIIKLQGNWFNWHQKDM